jgi:hypothetical protein
MSDAHGIVDIPYSNSSTCFRFSKTKVSEQGLLINYKF